MDEGDLELLDDNFEDGDGDGDAEEEGVTYKEVEIREQDRCVCLVARFVFPLTVWGIDTCQLQISPE